MTDDFSLATKFRTLSGPSRALSRLLLSVLTLIGAAWAAELQHYLPFTFFKEQYLGLFLALALGAVFLTVKGRRREAGDRVPWYDWLLALAGLMVGGFILVRYPALAYRLGVLTPDKYLTGTIAILIILEATRRLLGWTMVVVATLFILY